MWAFFRIDTPVCGIAGCWCLPDLSWNHEFQLLRRDAWKTARENREFAQTSVENSLFSDRNLVQGAFEVREHGQLKMPLQHRRLRCDRKYWDRPQLSAKLKPMAVLQTHKPCVELSDLQRRKICKEWPSQGSVCSLRLIFSSLVWRAEWMSRRVLPNGMPRDVSGASTWSRFPSTVVTSPSWMLRTNAARCSKRNFSCKISRDKTALKISEENTNKQLIYANCVCIYV